MKKLIFLFALMLTTLGMMSVCSCNGCKGGQEPKDEEPEVECHDYDGVVQDFTAGTEYIQALHRQTVNRVLGIKTFEWRNSKVIFNDEITYENIDDLHITDINDVFFYVNEKGPWVQYVNSNVKGGLQIPWPIQDIWIEDRNLSDAEIILDAESVLQKLKEWNGVLPQGAKSISLRRPTGPKDCNAQWVLGSIDNPLFIDAVTGDVRDSNPAFD